MPAPAFIQSILSSFPLVEYPEEQQASLASSSNSQYPLIPSIATLWIYGPGIDKERESFDVDCLAAQAQAAFGDVKLDIRNLVISEGAPGGKGTWFRIHL